MRTELDEVHKAHSKELGTCYLINTSQYCSLDSVLTISVQPEYTPYGHCFPQPQDTGKSASGCYLLGRKQKRKVTFSRLWPSASLARWLPLALLKGMRHLPALQNASWHIPTPRQLPLAAAAYY